MSQVHLLHLLLHTACSSNHQSPSGEEIRHDKRMAKTKTHASHNFSLSLHLQDSAACTVDVVINQKTFVWVRFPSGEPTDQMERNQTRTRLQSVRVICLHKTSSISPRRTEINSEARCLPNPHRSAFLPTNTRMQFQKPLRAHLLPRVVTYVLSHTV